ncbi:alpha/beta hydrolase [Aquicoccus sp. G2-2]|uniref:alpha/beta hydrolase n=1 Tax=Aquicoccus sp. G2-2 TaxID=3092120 RepID=UPI002ADF2014|nr:alpha/beta hydrolase [Aquicoccus sp. G2-2]MEA1112421.1 alpha/beta hydrolase [Aquicoccus sp. G2-2]
MSLRARLINRALRLIEKPRLTRCQEPESLRRGFERNAWLWFHGPRGSRYEAAALGGVPGLRVSGPGAGGERILLYFHGGGYVMGAPRTHRAMLARLSQLTTRVAYLPDYRKAPEHPFPAAVEDALAAYRALIEQTPADRVVMGGDSAGGGLVLALLSEICRIGLPQPGATFVFSPLTDMTFSGASFQQNAQADVMLPTVRAKDMQQMYLAGHDPRDPRASPLFANFKGAGPVWLSVGDTEILLDDTRRMAGHLTQEGVSVKMTVEHDLPHVWPIFQRLMPEADATLRALADWLNSR